MKTKSYTQVKVASFNGIYQRVITQPLSSDELGLYVFIFTKKEFGNLTVAGYLKEADDEKILVADKDFGLTVVNPKAVIGWTIPRWLNEDISNKDFQEHPERYCGDTYNKEGVQV